MGTEETEWNGPTGFEPRDILQNRSGGQRAAQWVAAVWARRGRLSGGSVGENLHGRPRRLYCAAALVLAAFGHPFSGSAPRDILQNRSGGQRAARSGWRVAGFAVVEHARQWMQDEGPFEVEAPVLAGEAASDSDSEGVFEDEDIARTVIHDRVPRVGTAVTMESFIAWRDAFEVEMAAAAGCVRDPRESKKTGKQLFEENADLARSDMGVTDADVFEAELADLPDGDELEALLAGGASFS